MGATQIPSSRSRLAQATLSSGMLKKYLISSRFDYSKMICRDAGPGYAQSMGWSWQALDSVSAQDGVVYIVDNRITEQDCFTLEALVARKRSVFVFKIVDPY